MDTKWKKYKDRLILIICICISIIAFNIDNVNWVFDEYEGDFYNSHQFQNIIWTLGTNSVYTVVGNNSTEKMKEYKKQSIEILNEFKSANVFVINNNDKNSTYSNQYIKDLNEYKEKIKDNYYNLEINFGSKDMQLIRNGKKSVYTLDKGAVPLLEKRKENVTTYISIPHIEDIKKVKDTDYSYEGVYSAYEYYSKYKLGSQIFLISKIVSSIIIMIAYIGVSKINKKILENNYKKQSLEKITIIIMILLTINVILNNFNMYILENIYNRYLILTIRDIVSILINGYIVFNVYKVIDSIRYIDKSKKGFLLGLAIRYEKYISSKNIKVVRITSIITIILTIIEIILVKEIVSSATYYYSGMVADYTHIKSIIGIIILKNLLLLIFVICNFNKIIDIDTALKEIKKGNLKHKIDINGNKILKSISSSINEIGDSVDILVDEKLKSEKMKTELITNVSHDLKTPLTAMINYISLLKKEDLKPEHVKGYIDVLDKRSQRLKILIDDLFEASKVSSGDIEINLEKTDINQLLIQSIVEMDDLIEKSQLDFIINTPKEEVYILADGRKTWRVLENLISNILKYSLKGTRVYIDLIKKENKVYITMKNISNHPLNFDSNEITERFTRGDLSRNTEGSGLGLAIAKGFMESQDGSLNIDILGDLFIVNLEFELI